MTIEDIDAENAIYSSYWQNRIVHAEYSDELLAQLQSDEGYEDDVEASGDTVEVWGTLNTQSGTGTWRVHVHR